MFFKIMMFFLGVFMCSLSLLFMILYLNLLSLGYKFGELVNFISKEWECYLIIPGLILIIFSLKKGKKNNDLCI